MPVTGKQMTPPPPSEVIKWVTQEQAVYITTGANQSSITKVLKYNSILKKINLRENLNIVCDAKFLEMAKYKQYQWKTYKHNFEWKLSAMFCKDPFFHKWSSSSFIVWHSTEHILWLWPWKPPTSKQSKTHQVVSLKNFKTQEIATGWHSVEFHFPNQLRKQKIRLQALEIGSHQK